MNSIPVDFRKLINDELVRRGKKSGWLSQEVEKAFPEVKFPKQAAWNFCTGRKQTALANVERILAVLDFQIKKPGS